MPPPYRPDRWAEYHQDKYIPLSQLYYIRAVMRERARGADGNQIWPPTVTVMAMEGDVISNAVTRYAVKLWRYVGIIRDLISMGYREHLDAVRRRLF